MSLQFSGSDQCFWAPSLWNHTRTSSLGVCCQISQSLTIKLVKPLIYLSDTRLSNSINILHFRIASHSLYTLVIIVPHSGRTHWMRRRSKGRKIQLQCDPYTGLRPKLRWPRTERSVCLWPNVRCWAPAEVGAGQGQSHGFKLDQTEKRKGERSWRRNEGEGLMRVDLTFLK